MQEQDSTGQKNRKGKDKAELNGKGQVGIGQDRIEKQERKGLGRTGWDRKGWDRTVVDRKGNRISKNGIKWKSTLNT